MHQIERRAGEKSAERAEFKNEQSDTLKLLKDITTDIRRSTYNLRSMEKYHSIMSLYPPFSEKHDQLRFLALEKQGNFKGYCSWFNNNAPKGYKDYKGSVDLHKIHSVRNELKFKIQGGQICCEGCGCIDFTTVSQCDQIPTRCNASSTVCTYCQFLYSFGEVCQCEVGGIVDDSTPIDYGVYYPQEPPDYNYDGETQLR